MVTMIVLRQKNAKIQMCAYTSLRSKRSWRRVARAMRALGPSIVPTSLLSELGAKLAAHSFLEERITTIEADDSVYEDPGAGMPSVSRSLLTRDLKQVLEDHAIG